MVGSAVSGASATTTSLVAVAVLLDESLQVYATWYVPAVRVSTLEVVVSVGLVSVSSVHVAPGSE